MGGGKKGSTKARGVQVSEVTGKWGNRLRKKANEKVKGGKKDG